MTTARWNQDTRKVSVLQNLFNSGESDVDNCEELQEDLSESFFFFPYDTMDINDALI